MSLKKIESIQIRQNEHPPKRYTTFILLHSYKMSPITNTFWVFDDDALPCRCCSPIEAIEDGFWNCKERRWVIVDSYFPLEHTAETCDGKCGNLFHTSFIGELGLAELSGRGWGDVQYDWEVEAYNSLTLAEKEARHAMAAAEKAEEERLKPLLAEHHAQVDRMRRCRQTANEKRNKGRKEAAPCRSLYDFQREGGCQTLHISTECWAHEFTDSLSSEIVDEKTGRFLPMAEKLGIRQAMNEKECGIFRKESRYVLKWMPHVCYMSHPGEPTWNPEWTKNRNVARPPRTDPRLGSPGNWRNTNQNSSSYRNFIQSTTLPSPQTTNQHSNNRFANLDTTW